MRYTKKPVEISAFQMTKETFENKSAWPAWLTEAWKKNFTEVGSLYSPSAYSSYFPNLELGNDLLYIKTLEGNQLVSWGDYVIRGVKGEIYPCKPDIFEMTYDKVDEVKVIDVSDKSLMDAYFDIDPSGKLWEEVKSFKVHELWAERTLLICVLIIMVSLFVNLIMS